MRFKDKSVIVTGGAQGIGRACVEAFAAEGARVLVADMAMDAAAETERAVTEAGGQVRVVKCDVGDKAQVEAMIETAVTEFGGVDVLINNAGIIKTADFLELEEDDFDRVLRVNLKGMFLVAQAAARRMVEQGGGAIVNMSSVNAIMAIPNQVPYNVSKGGVNQLTRVTALALADKGVRVNAIGPGTIMTEMAKVVMADDAARRKIMSRTPMKRLGLPEEVARVAMFLAGEDSSYITGQTIYCDGGRMPLNYVVPVDD